MKKPAIFRAFAPPIILLASACGSQYTTTTRTFDPDGELVAAAVDSRGEVISELRRQFREDTLFGEGRIANANEGLARRAATQLAVAELAGKVETAVQSNQTIYNNSEVRDVVETQVAALVRNYEIDFAGYEEGSDTYVVRVSITAQKLVEEFERRLLKNP